MFHAQPGNIEVSVKESNIYTIMYIQNYVPKLSNYISHTHIRISENFEEKKYVYIFFSMMKR